MNFTEIEQSIRQTLDDNSTTDKLWSQADILEYAIDAENEACERAGLLKDSETSGVAIYASGAIHTGTDGQILSISPLVIDILSFKIIGTSNIRNTLFETTEMVLDSTYQNWITDTGTPRSWFRKDTNKTWVYPKPSAENAAVNLTVSRFPLTDMTINGSPEVDARYHPGLLEWILHRAYMKNDSETLNVGKAKDHKKKFEEFFGPKKILED